MNLSTAYHKGSRSSYREYNMTFRGPFNMAEMHKIIGYGLQRVSPSNINFDGFLGYENQFNLDGFATFLKQHDINTNIDSDIDIKSCVYYTAKSIIVIPPQMIKQWRRSGDIMDRVDSVNSKELTLLRHGIPGYRYLENKDNHQRVGVTVANLFFDLYDKWLFEKSEAVKMGMEGPLNELAYDMGFGTIDAAVCNSQPYVPDNIRHLCSYLQIFKDDRTIDELKPLMCVYWR